MTMEELNTLFLNAKLEYAVFNQLSMSKNSQKILKKFATSNSNNWTKLNTQCLV